MTQGELWEMVLDVGREAWRARARAKSVRRLRLAWPAVGHWLALELASGRVVIRTPDPANDNAGRE